MIYFLYGEEALVPDTYTNCGPNGHRITYIDVYRSINLWPVDPQFVVITTFSDSTLEDLPGRLPIPSFLRS
jgi:hypothetical protein